jgi:Fe-Mn family superoxide dismutase
MGLMGSGWIWLVADAAGTLGLIGTYGAGTVLVQNRTQRGEYGDIVGLDAAAISSVSSSSTPTPAIAPADFEHDRFARPVATSRGGGNQRQRRSLHTSLVPQAPSDQPTGFSSGAYGYGSSTALRGAGGRGRASNRGPTPVVAADLYPLLCLSVHEHAWTTDYGLWGKEAYAAQFWDVVDWADLERTYEALDVMTDPSAASL